LCPCIPKAPLEKSLIQVHMKCLVTNCMEHSLPSEANSRSAGQKMSLPLWNPNVHYCDRFPRPSRIDLINLDIFILFLLIMLYFVIIFLFD
jgi:hypothetical protein